MSIESAIERQAAVQVHPSRNIISEFSEGIQYELRLRAFHAVPRFLQLTMNDDDLALLESEIALSLARLQMDVMNLMTKTGLDRESSN